jgi:D-aminopeptidase
MKKSVPTFTTTTVKRTIGAASDLSWSRDARTVRSATELYLFENILLIALEVFTPATYLVLTQRDEPFSLSDTTWLRPATLVG